MTKAIEFSYSLTTDIILIWANEVNHLTELALHSWSKAGNMPLIQQSVSGWRQVKLR